MSTWGRRNFPLESYSEALVAICQDSYWATRRVCCYLHSLSLWLVVHAEPPAGGNSSLLTKPLYYISWPVLTGSAGTQARLVQSQVDMAMKRH